MSTGSKRLRLGNGIGTVCSQSLSTPMAPKSRNDFEVPTHEVNDTLNKSIPFQSVQSGHGSIIRPDTNSNVISVPLMVLGGGFHNGNTDNVSNVTNEMMCKAELEMAKTQIHDYTQHTLFPIIKFFSRVADDKLLQWSTRPMSLCQLVIRNCNLTSDDLEEAWLTYRRYVFEKLGSVRNDRSQALIKAFYGKQQIHDIDTTWKD